MRSADNFPAQLPTYYDESGPGSEDLSDDELLYEELGYCPARLFRQRPEPEVFDELAINIARAVACMPKLTYINMEFSAFHRDSNTNGAFEHFKGYEGWAFYFRSTNNARFASKYFYEEWCEPGPDFTAIECPRTEWIFQCPYRQVQWEEPDAAKALWREKFPNIHFDLVTKDYNDDSGCETWERRREGMLICSSQRTFDVTVEEPDTSTNEE